MARLHKIGLALALISSAASGQWYQGPSGGKGGDAFDFWTESSNATDIDEIGIIDTGTIRCLVVVYRQTPTNPGRRTAFRHGECGTNPGEIGWDHSRGMALDPDEYLLGVEGTYDDHISSIRFFTNKRNSDVWGHAGSRSFGYTAPSGQMIVALTGRAGDNLDAVGVMYAPCGPPKACK